MSELQRQSTAALERLCAHYEQEQRRQGEQIEALLQRTERHSEENATLRQQFEQLEGLVKYLAQDYRTLAETLREPWM